MRFPYAGLLALGLAAGCGAGGGPSGAHVTIDWGARSRTIDGPSSALSAVIMVRGADPAGNDLLFTVNRDSQLEAHPQTYELPLPVRPGTYELAVSFLALMDGRGDRMGTAAGTISIDRSGTGSANVTTIGTVLSVQVSEDQSIRVGEHADLLVAVFGGDPAQYLGVTYGAIFYNVVEGQDILRVDGGMLVGVSPGAASVTATVDGITSQPVRVAVVTQ